MYTVLYGIIYLSIREPQTGCQLSTIWLGYVLLDLEPFLKAFPLQIGKNCPCPGFLALTTRAGKAAAAKVMGGQRMM